MITGKIASATAPGLSRKTSAFRKRTRQSKFCPRATAVMAPVSENKAVALAKKCHAFFRAGDMDGVVSCWADDVVHTGWAPTSDEPFMGVFTGIEEGKKFLAAVGELSPTINFTDTMFIPVDDTTCLQCVETTLSNGKVIHELMHWNVDPSGEKMVKWALYGDPYSYKKVKEGKEVKVRKRSISSTPVFS